MPRNRFAERSLKAHKKLNGKISIVSKVPLKTTDDLSIYYTPGVGAAAAYLAKHKSAVREMTGKRNLVAIVTDGSAVLGLGNIGPEGAMPVMEGKAVIFKEFAGIDGFPIILNTQNTQAIIETVKNISPIFGGINLEDIAAPRCFEIEEALQRELDIPVVHDDQHGVAIAALAGLINAFKVVRKNLKLAKVVVIGAGAAGTGITQILLHYGIKNILVLDSQGILNRKRHDLDFHKKELARLTNPKNLKGGLEEAMVGADVVIGVSRSGILRPEHISSMNRKPIVFALANPTPEIMPREAKQAGAYVMATGRSDFPNQINNSLVFPGLFRGALDNQVKKITYNMKIRVAKKLAALIKKPTTKRIIPSVFDKRVVKVVARAIR